MRIVVLYGWVCLGMAGCSMLPAGMFKGDEPSKATVQTLVPVPPPQPVGYTQTLSGREPYTGALPYVICFGPDCNQPTPKSPVRRAPPPRIAQESQQAAAIQPVEQRPDASILPAVEKTPKRVKESIGFHFNSTEVDPNSIEALGRIVQRAKNAKEIWIKGFAGLTDTNLEKEDAVMALALARAREIERLIKKTGSSAHITVGAELVRCKSEDECMKRFEFGGRRADLEIVIIDGEKSGESK